MKAKNMLENLSKKFKLDKRVIIIALVGIFGIVLLTLSELAPENGQEKAQAEKNEPLYAYEEQLEERLTKLIGSINGAGRTGVMVTLESTDENVYATQDKYSENSGEKDYVIVKKGGGDDGLLLKVAEPQVRESPWYATARIRRRFVRK